MLRIEINLNWIFKNKIREIKIKTRGNKVKKIEINLKNGILH
jgi:hypothetical protein